MQSLHCCLRASPFLKSSHRIVAADDSSPSSGKQNMKAGKAARRSKRRFFHATAGERKIHTLSVCLLQDKGGTEAIFTPECATVNTSNQSQSISPWPWRTKRRYFLGAILLWKETALAAVCLGCRCCVAGTLLCLDAGLPGLLVSASKTHLLSC